MRLVTIDLDDEQLQPTRVQDGVVEGDREFDYEAGYADGFNWFRSLVTTHGIPAAT